MNRINIWAAFAAVTLAGCANEEITQQSNLPVSDGGRKPIEVSTYMPRATRLLNAQEATISTLTEQGGGFSLTAATGSEEYIFEEKLFYADAQGSKCSSANGEIFYWPEEGTVSFYAYAPMAQTGADGLCTLDAYNNVLYVTPDGKTDVIAAYTTVDATETDGTVSLEFQHVMAQVQMYVKCNADNLPEGAVFTLDSISVDAPNSSTVDFAQKNITGNTSGYGPINLVFYNSKSGPDPAIPLSNKLSLVATGMLSASGALEGGTAMDETTCPLTVAYSVTIGQSTKNYVKTDEIKLVARYKNVINITVTGDAPILITADVDEWDEAETQEPTLVDAAPVDNSGVDNEGRPYIDLGLPSGTLWATYNIGALLPEEGGNFFAWGETDSKDDFTNNYHFYQDGVDDKYSMNEGKNILDPEDDAATQNWGDDWCMPSVEKARELNDETYVTQEWTQVGEMYGLKITSKTFPENYIFLPAAGIHWPESDIQGVGTYGYYWTNEKYPNSSCGICYRVADGENIRIDETQQRISGFLIRAVRKQN